MGNDGIVFQCALSTMQLHFFKENLGKQVICKAVVKQVWCLHVTAI